MGIELMPGLTNVVRFPLERRVKPSLDLLRDLAPDPREVGLVIDAFGFEDGVEHTRDSADEEMAEYIVNNVRPEPGAARRAELDALLVPLVERAVQACRDAHEASVSAVASQRLLVKAQAEGGYWIAPLADQATDRSNHAARLLIDAYVAWQETEGSARAIDLARRGEAWTPFDAHAEARALFFGESMPSARG